MLGLRDKKPKTIEPDAQTLQKVFDTIDKATIPVSGTTIYRLAHIESTDLDECLQVLLAKKQIEIVYERTGLDGIKRPYYQVSQELKLDKTKEQVGNFVSKMLKKFLPYVDDGVSYSVRVSEHKEFNAVFTNRKEARNYKNYLSTTKMKLTSEIYYQKFEGGLQVDERKVS